jgi:hypothetical protein
MPFLTRPNFEDRQVVQYSGDTITLSGNTHINNVGYLQINAPILDFTGTTTASTQYIIAGVSGYVNFGEPSSFIVQPPVILQSGTTGTTTVDVTGYILGSLDPEGRVSWYPASFFLSGGTGGGGNPFTGGSSSCIADFYVTNIHGCSPINIQPTSSDNVYLVNGGGNVGINVLTATTKLHVSGNTLFNGEVMWLSNIYTTIVPTPAFNGFVNYQYFDGFNGFTTTNTSPSGNSSVSMSNDTGVLGYISVPGSLDYRTGLPVTGEEFYRNKMIIKALSPSEGMVFNPASGDAGSTFWWEMDGRSLMILKGDGIDKGFLGLALNIDGTEMPTSTLQIGGTGTTGTFKYIDGNQSTGYVLTTDGSGNATWQPNTGTAVTGNTVGPYVYGSAAGSIIPLSGTNITESNLSVILGGSDNGISGSTSNRSSIVNGRDNSITRLGFSLIGGGRGNIMLKETSGGSLLNYHSIVNGFQNKINLISEGNFNFICGGQRSIISGNTISYGIIGNGIDNYITSNTYQSTILNGNSNILDRTVNGTILNGVSNYTHDNYYTTIINGESNEIAVGSGHSVITSGLFNRILQLGVPTTTLTYNLIGTGSGNTINYSTYTSINNGRGNIIDYSASSNINNGGFNYINDSDLSTIINGVSNTINTADYSTIINGVYNVISGFTGSTIIGGNSITAIANDTVYTPNLDVRGDLTMCYGGTAFLPVISGCSPVTIQGHTVVNNQNTFGPIRPNYISDLLTSGNTTGGTYNITIPAGWVVEDVVVYQKTADSGGIIYFSMGTSGSVWAPQLGFSLTTSNMTTLMDGIDAIGYNRSNYFAGTDILTIYFSVVAPLPNPVAITDGEYKVMIRYWDGTEAGIF